MNGIKEVHRPNIGFPEERNSQQEMLREPLKAGDIVIIDLDFIYEENDRNIIWEDYPSHSIEFEIRYRKEKTQERLQKIQERRKNGVKGKPRQLGTEEER